MSMTDARLTIPLSLLGCLCAAPAAADITFFNTGNPDGKMATASRPDGGTSTTFEIESADDFVLTRRTLITDATFTGLLTGGAAVSDIGEVVVEIYRVFPKDSTVPPSMKVPTRVNSPSDVAFASRDSASGDLKFTTDLVSPTFTADNSVQPNGIHLPKTPPGPPGGDGPVSGEEVKFTISFTMPFLLPADHYFFVPQVELSDGTFLWLSAPKPIMGSGTTPFPPGFTDLQTWTRDAALDPDWLRVGTDIVGGTPAPTFNAAFSLSTVPEPSTWAMMLLGFAGLGFVGYRRARKASPASA
jgi:PEP-CTERM motif